MEKKKMKLWKKILIVIVIILMIAIAIVARRAIILADIDKKVTDYENNNKNIYSKTMYEFSDYNSTIERFIKDDVDKMILERTSKDGEKVTVTQIIYPTQRKMFTEARETKVMYIYEEEAPVRGSHLEAGIAPIASYNTIMNFAYSTNLPERILNAIVTSIKTVEIDGKQCYELSSLFSSNVLYQEGTVQNLMYIEKETGLPVKVIQKVNEDGEIIENTTKYQYSFGTVTDEDMQEPDNTQYTLKQ